MKILANKLKIVIDDTGYVTSMICDKEYLFEKTPLIRIVVDNEILNPTAFVKNGNHFDVVFNNHTVEMLITEHNSHAKFTITNIDSDVSTLLWGTYPITIGDIIGEMVGVSRNDTYAVGYQGLNAKTMAGYPKNIEVMSFKGNVVDEVIDATLTRSGYNECAAFPTKFGSVLQAYSKNFEKEMPNDEGSIIGSSIAFFGCDVCEALNTISEIELSENLPHPMINGKWGKDTIDAINSYLILEFSKDNLEEILGYAKKGGFNYVYHTEPFKNWGHFDLRDDLFPAGYSDMKDCVDLAKKYNIELGVHTLSNFTKTNDPYVTPIPDKRLVRAAVSPLICDISEEDSTIYIENGIDFEDIGYLGAVVIEEEIIQYIGAEEVDGKWQLVECTRGAFNTKKSNHKKDVLAERLKDHGYKVVFPNNELQDEYSNQFVKLFNETGLKQISFDGLEGCLESGFETYGLTRMVENCYKGWNNEIINDASMLTHYLWHIHTRMNWGEPWGAAMREGQVRTRIVNQKFFERNLFPKMLGWFLLRVATKKFEASMLDDVEWALSKAAGFESGFAMCIDYSVLKGLGNIEELLNAIKIWEEARNNRLFNASQRERMKEPKAEWHLEKSEDTYTLYPMAVSEEFICDPNELQPGQPGGSDWTYNNPFMGQTAQFRLRVTETYGNGGFIENIGLAINGRKMIFRTKVESGQYLIYKGGKTADVCDANFNILETITGGLKELEFISGDQAVAFTCDFNYVAQPEVQVKFISFGEGEELK